MNDVLAVLKSTLGGLAAVLLLWHLFGISKWLAGRGGRQVRHPRTRTPDEPSSNVPIEPR